MSSPIRISWAVEQLDIAPEDRILEFGCGGGVALALVADQLTSGCVTGIDRSAIAIDRARARTAGHGSHVIVQQVELAHFDDEPASFDKAFAVNVNVFWTGPANSECDVLARVLRPGGVLQLVYDGTRDVAPTVAANLQRHGFMPEVTHHHRANTHAGSVPL